jgi:hypothetical protein
MFAAPDDNKMLVRDDVHEAMRLVETSNGISPHSLNRPASSASRYSARLT